MYAEVRSRLSNTFVNDFLETLRNQNNDYERLNCVIYFTIQITHNET